uniref:Uncharacterized protein n=1 Tax=Clytia hemisphaerica TaxID=252671 RepID=A0A7M5WWG6_9CNID
MMWLLRCSLLAWLVVFFIEVHLTNANGDAVDHYIHIKNFDHITNRKIGNTRKIFPYHHDHPHGDKVHEHENEVHTKPGHHDDDKKTRPQFVGPKHLRRKTNQHGRKGLRHGRHGRKGLRNAGEGIRNAGEGLRHGRKGLRHGRHGRKGLRNAGEGIRNAGEGLRHGRKGLRHGRHGRKGLRNEGEGLRHERKRLHRLHQVGTEHHNQNRTGRHGRRGGRKGKRPNQNGRRQGQEGKHGRRGGNNKRQGGKNVFTTVLGKKLKRHALKLLQKRALSSQIEPEVVPDQTAP